VRNLVLWLQKDADSWTITETFAINEVEIWTTPQTSTAPLPDNTCASSGS